MSTAQQCAARVLARLKKEPEDTRLAVFITDDKADAMATKTTTSLFTKALARFPKRLIGIYTNTATEDWIVEDLRYCGMTV